MSYNGQEEQVIIFFTTYAVWHPMVVHWNELKHFLLVSQSSVIINSILTRNVMHDHMFYGRIWVWCTIILWVCIIYLCKCVVLNVFSFCCSFTKKKFLDPLGQLLISNGIEKVSVSLNFEPCFLCNYPWTVYQTHKMKRVKHNSNNGEKDIMFSQIIYF